MFNTVRQTACCGLLLIILCSASICAAQDRAIHRTLRFASGTSHADLARRILRGTSHVYHFRARKDQYMVVILIAGKNTSLTIYSTTSGQLDGADGVRDWEGALPETDDYIIEISTDRTGDYKLTVTIE